MRDGRSTIRDVARRAGVSVSTVSYVFSGRAGVSEDTAKRVRTAAEELHYRPNGLIRSLQQGKTRVIGACLPPPEPGAVLTALLQGAAGALRRTDYDLLFYTPRPGRFASGDASAFLDCRVDGLLWIPSPELDPRSLPTLAAAGLPTVVVLEPDVPDGLGCVHSDPHTAGRLAGQHLVSLGHRRLAVWGDPDDPRSNARLNGFRSAVAEGRAEVRQLPDGASPAEALDRTTAAGGTAVFCSVQAALSLWDAARTRGLSVPGDLSLVAPADGADGRCDQAGLTTVADPVVEIGATAVRMLADMLDHGRAPARVRLPPVLCDRGSAGPPR